jgi:hypothetical protein
MCDASDYVVGVVLGQNKDKKYHGITYASKTLIGAQLNYATIEKELKSFRCLLLESPRSLLETWTASIRKIMEHF